MVPLFFLIDVHEQHLNKHKLFWWALFHLHQSRLIQKLALLKANTEIEKFAIDNGIIYLDYYSSMVDEDNALKKEYGYDGVHPNKKGYQVMSLLAENAINRILNN